MPGDIPDDLEEPDGQEASHPMSPDAQTRSALLLGRDHPGLDEVRRVGLAQGTTVCALSAGSDPFSPAMLSKGDPEEPNEDALLALDEGDLLLLAVADAHHGVESSHELLEGLAAAGRIPRSPDELQDLLARVPALGPPSRSATTLLVAVYDRTDHRGFGLSFGDSSLHLVGPERVRLVNTRSHEFVSPRDPSTLGPDRGLPFHFRSRPGRLLVAFTDGVDECHYRSRATSVRPSHLKALFDETGPDPGTYADRLVELALEGVEGHPGGQDNIALICSRTEMP